MKKIFILFMWICISLDSTSQSCLPDGIIFNTQSQLDSFQVNYPGCSQIEGNVTINGDSAISNLNGLSMLESIGGDLSIFGNKALHNLTGLGSLNYVAGYIEIGDFNLNTGEFEGNSGLTGLDGLSNLSVIGKGLLISDNGNLTSLAGLENIDTIAMWLSITDNDALASLNGLEGLTSLGGLLITGNDALLNLTGLDNLGYIENDLEIGTLNIYEGGEGNDALENLTGLQNLISVGGNVSLYYNNSLTSLTGLENLVSIGGDLIIISNVGLTNLAAFSALASIEGALLIRFNFSLTDLSGLDQLASIGQDFYLSDNLALASLSGLDQLNFIGSLGIDNNDLITSLSGLEGLDSIGDYIWIGNNADLNSLTGLDNLNGGSIQNLSIRDNGSLSVCEARSICDYLASPNGTVEIHDNAPGCNSHEEVLTACSFGLSGSNLSENQFTVSPNPASTQITIETSALSDIDQLSIYDISGQQLMSVQMSKLNTLVDIRGLPSGLYIVRLTGQKTVKFEKFVKTNWF